jgi:hypothetical protein
MNFSIFKIFQIFGIVSNWAAKALADNKITLEEAVQLATLIAAILGVKIEIEVPAGIQEELSEDEELWKTLPVLDERSNKPADKPVED